MTKIYIASKASHRPHWRELRGHGHNIISRWIDVDDKYIGTTFGDPVSLDYRALWDTCVQDVIACDVLICYVEPDEVLKGALIEVGVALGLGKRVICVGHKSDYLKNGTWINHRSIELVAGWGFGDILESLRVQET